MKKTILLTFDYELFLKFSGTVENCLLKPVDHYLDITQNTGIAATFYVDTLFLSTVRESHHDVYRKISRQLQKLVLAGNRIELHLHPSWLDAREIGKGGSPYWIFDKFDRYSLSALNNEQIDQMFREGIMELEDIARKIYSNYKVCSYRAGGWSIEPFSKIRGSMMKYGIFCDSTVCAGLYRKSQFQNFDFTGAPDWEYWTFDEEPAYPAKGPFMEIPISTYQYSPVKKLMRKFRLKLERQIHAENCRYFGDGIGMDANDMKPLETQNIYQRFVQPNMYTLQDVYPGYNSQLIKKEKRHIVTFISHPKKLNMNSFKELLLLNNDEHKFITVRELLDRIS